MGEGIERAHGLTWEPERNLEYHVDGDEHWLLSCREAERVRVFRSATASRVWRDIARQQ